MRKVVCLRRLMRSDGRENVDGNASDGKSYGDGSALPLGVTSVPIARHEERATMRRLKSLLSLVAIFLGGMGLVISFAAIAILWLVSVHFDRGVVKVFSKLDHSLIVVRQRLDQSR